MCSPKPSLVPQAAKVKKAPQIKPTKEIKAIGGGGSALKKAPAAVSFAQRKDLDRVVKGTGIKKGAKKGKKKYSEL